MIYKGNFSQSKKVVVTEFANLIFLNNTLENLNKNRNKHTCTFPSIKVRPECVKRQTAEYDRTWRDLACAEAFSERNN